MSATTEQIQLGNEVELKTRLKATWMTGDYDRFSRYMERGAEQFFQRIGVKPGARLLDVGCGSGQLSLIAARTGADVTGCDIATNWVEKARSRAAAEGLRVRFEEGDAEALPYGDGQFDVVASLIGAMFASRPDLVSDELVRVCRPGGVIAMANWTPGGFVGKMFKTISRYISPSGMPSPLLWGDEGTVRERLSEGTAHLEFALRTYPFEYPFPPEEVVEFFRVHYGPMTRAFASLDPNGQEQLRNELVELWSAHNRGAEGRTKFVALTGSYHGETLGALSVGDIPLYRRVYAPLLLETLFAPSPDAWFAHPGETPAQCAQRAADGLQALLERHAGEVCALILEPLLVVSV